MNYETPELTTLTPAINAIQGGPKTQLTGHADFDTLNEIVGAYADWED